MIGYVARVGIRMICSGDACLVIGSHARMQRILARYYPNDVRRATIESTCLEHLLFGLFLGGAYDFDQQAYERFRPHVTRCDWLEPPPPFHPRRGDQLQLMYLKCTLLPCASAAGWRGGAVSPPV